VPPGARGGQKIVCTLCPRLCQLREGQAGFCYVRQVHGGELVTLAWGRPTGFAVDPVEKKPLNHFLPGTSILSFGTAGCNLGCTFCQNWSISKARDDDASALEATPQQVVAAAQRTGCPSIAMTYNDPVIFAEFAIDITREARGAGLHSVLVTNGYVSEQARGELFDGVSAANVDLKAFTEDFYRKQTLSHLEPVLDTLRWIVRETQVWLEVTNLIIPGHNDTEDETRQLARWMVQNLGVDVPLHLTAFHPDWKLRDPPPTPASTLRRARQIARTERLRYVYTGNVHDREGGTTRCPRCDAVLIERDWHAIEARALVDGRCAGCGERIAGVFPHHIAPQSTPWPRRITLT